MIKRESKAVFPLCSLLFWVCARGFLKKAKDGRELLKKFLPSENIVVAYRLAGSALSTPYFRSSAAKTMLHCFFLVPPQKRLKIKIGLPQGACRLAALPPFFVILSGAPSQDPSPQAQDDSEGAESNPAGVPPAGGRILGGQGACRPQESVPTAISWLLLVSALLGATPRPGETEN